MSYKSSPLIIRVLQLVLFLLDNGYGQGGGIPDPYQQQQYGGYGGPAYGGGYGGQGGGYY